MKVIRVITTNESIPRYFLSLINEYKSRPKDELIIVGEEVDVYKNVYPWIKFVSINIQRKPSLKNDIIACYKLCCLILNEKPDIVHSSFPKSGLISSIASYICRVQVRCHTFTGQLWNRSRHPKTNLMYWCDFLISKLNTFNMTDGEDQSMFLESHGIMNGNERIPCLANGSFCGVDFKFLNETSQKDHVLEEKLKNKFVYIYLARKTIDKGAVDIIKSFSKVRQANNRAVLLFIGPDESNGAVDIVKKEYPIDGIIDIGAVDDIHKYLKLGDVFCLPSYREGFSTILVQAAAHGLPCLGYDIEGVSEPIRKCDSGFVVEKGNVDKFSEVMSELYIDENKRTELSKKAKINSMNKFNSSVVNDALIIKYNELHHSYKTKIFNS